MNELDIFSKLNAIGTPQFSATFDEENERAQKIAAHKTWLNTIRKERPSTNTHFSVAVYIRYFNQTKYENYLDYHKQQFENTIANCPNWTLVGIYVDEGSTAPNIESAPELRRLLNDCMEGKVDLIITQKVSNMSKKTGEITLLSRLLAAQPKPVGIYFISEDIYTAASYYQQDLRDVGFLPTSDWKLLPDED